MIAISISHALAAEHPEFMAGCAERRHHVEVFDGGRTGEKAPRVAAERPGAAPLKLPSIPASSVLAAASPSARRLWGICDRCWQGGFVRETDRQTIGLCDPCIDAELRRLRRFMAAVAEMIAA